MNVFLFFFLNHIVFCFTDRGKVYSAAALKTIDEKNACEKMFRFVVVEVVAFLFSRKMKTDSFC